MIQGPEIFFEPLKNWTFHNPTHAAEKTDKKLTFSDPNIDSTASTCLELIQLTETGSTIRSKFKFKTLQKTEDERVYSLIYL